MNWSATIIMCIFQSGKDIPPLVRLSLRTLQYLVIPLLSISILAVGSHKLGQCQAQPNLPVWHIVAGASGLLAPLLYLCFDEVNVRLGKSLPKVVIQSINLIAGFQSTNVFLIYLKQEHL